MAENVNPSASNQQQHKSSIAKRLGVSRHNSMKETILTKALGSVMKKQTTTSLKTRAASMDFGIMRSAMRFLHIGKDEKADTDSKNNSDSTASNQPPISNPPVSNPPVSNPPVSDSPVSYPPVSHPPASHQSVASPTTPSTPTTPRRRRIEHVASPTLLPPERPILSLDISMIPEFDSLNIEDYRSIWVAVDVSGHIKEAYSTAAVQLTQLDVAVVLDTSAYASEECLLSACNIVRQLAHLLNNPKDRLAIFCTSHQHPSGSSTGCMLRPLKTIDIQSVEGDLQLAVDCRRSDDPSIDLSETLAAAFRLLYAHSNLAAKAGIEQNPRFVIVVSSNSAECVGVLGSMAPVPVHVVHPGALPWYGRRESNDGFLVDNSCLDPAGKLTRRNMREIIHFARAKIVLGQIKKVVVDIQPGRNAEIEEILGAQKLKLLHPGQVACLAVKVKVPGLQLSEAERKRNRTQGLFQDLEGILGIAKSELLKVSVEYKHSLFPQSTILKMSKVCTLDRTDPSSGWSNPSGSSNSKGHPQQRFEIYPRLMRSIAMSHPPHEALEHMNRVFSKLNIGNDALANLNVMISELEYHAHMFEKFNLPTIKDVSSRPEDNMEALQERFPGRRLERAESSSMGSIKNAESAASVITTIRNQDPFTDNTPEDEARTVWKHMRKTSKPENEEEELGDSEEQNETMERIREQAIQNKRSVGADTLRSLSGGSSRLP